MSMTRESLIDVIETSPTEFQTFVLGGINAVKHMPPNAHDMILADLATALNCSKDALDFLIAANPETLNADLDFPDAQRRRSIAMENHLSIAQ